MIRNKACNWIIPSNLNGFSRYGLFFLIGIDIAFILLHLSLEFTTSSVPRSFAITKDGSFPEIYQYLKYGAIALILGRLAFQSRSLLYAAWALLFTYMLLDDWLSFHESLGLFLSNTLNLPNTSFLRAQDFGELMTTSIFGLGLVALVVVSHLRCPDTQDREISGMLAVLLILLAIAGIGFDMLQVAISTVFSTSAFLSNVFALLEDGGEMFIASLITWFVVQIPMGKRQELNRSNEVKA